MRAHLIIDLQRGAVELHTDTSPKPPKAVRGKDKRKRAGRKKAKSAVTIKQGDLMKTE